MKHKSLVPSHSESERSDHILHLYTSEVDKYGIQRAFLTSMRHDEKAIIVSSEKPETIRQEINSLEVEIQILKSEDIRSIETELSEYSTTWLIIDAGSISNQTKTEIEQRERYLNEISENHPLNCLCTYNVTLLPPDMIKRLTEFHNHLKLTTNDLTLILGDFIDRSMLSNNSMKKMVKDNLEAIVLALLQRKAMCGIDIIGTIHKEFDVLNSPGTVYPLLHSLQKRGLITSVKEGKEKRYAPSEDSELEIRRLVYEHVLTRKLLNSYLQKELVEEERKPTVETLKQALDQNSR